MKARPSPLAVLAVALVCASPLAVAQQTAAVSATAKSFQLLVSDPFYAPAYGNLYTYFSTFNGTTGEFLIDSLHSATSGEVRPRANTPGVYEGAYGQATRSQYVDYGSFTLTIPQTDADGDGVPDFIQVSRLTSLTTSGTGYSMVAAAPFSISVRITRSANSLTGRYSATTQLSGYSASTVTGELRLNSISGTATYTRGVVNRMEFAAYFPGVDEYATGSTTYSLGSGGNALSYGAFSLTAGDGTVYLVSAGTLTRSGSSYRGTLTLADGILTTYWADLRDYYLSFSDPSDSDGDGIPDLSDALPAGAAMPAITSQPASQSVTISDSVTFSVGVSGVPAARYQWRKNGVAISGATSASYKIASAVAASAGSYSVVATNSLGSATSSAATLTVNPVVIPVAIVDQPVDRVAIAGSAVQLTVSATGTPAPTFQWHKGGRVIANATNRSLILGSKGSADAGIYDVVLTSGATSTLSRPTIVGITPAAGQRTAGSVATRAEWQDIRHPVTGAVYDQFLLTGAAGTFTADPKQIARMSFLDENASIVQVEMSGAGAITVVLDNPSGPMAPALYNQSGIEYMKGKATIILAGADATTHFTIYSVGSFTNPGATRPEVVYTGWASVAAAGIVSSSGQLGGIHQGNAAYNSDAGLTGIYAPTVTSVGGLVVVHGIEASSLAQPYLFFGTGGAAMIKIAGTSPLPAQWREHHCPRSRPGADGRRPGLLWPGRPGVGDPKRSLHRHRSGCDRRPGRRTVNEIDAA
ncbi:MAG: immunoglobulin domain-containing protein [Opitutaceae bacterium]|nr:immunoglobulin domain-containing protein [Opitutaceae bacterium]